MKKILGIFGTTIIICAFVFILVHSFIRVSSSAEDNPKDIFGLSVPTPPIWTTYVPYLGSGVGMIFELFSLHGLLLFAVVIPLFAIGGFLIALSSKEDRADSSKKSESKTPVQEEDTTKNKNNNFLSDFGMYLADTQGVNNQNIIITDNFLMLQLILHPNDNFSLTAKLNGMIASFDFGYDVLKMILLLLVESDLMSRDQVKDLVSKAQNRTVVLDLEKGKIMVTGAVLSCKLGEMDRSTKTGEVFRPVVIDHLEIVSTPPAVRVDQYNDHPTLFDNEYHQTDPKGMHSTQEEYGYWDPSGIERFWLFPKVSFIKIQDQDLVLTKSIKKYIPDGEKNLVTEDDYHEVIDKGLRILFLRIYDMNPTVMSERLIDSFFNLLLRNAKSVPVAKHQSKKAGLKIEVVVGVDSNPELYLDTYLKSLATNESVSRYTSYRPSHTLPD